MHSVFVYLYSFALGIKKIYLDVISYHIHKTPIFFQSLLPEVLRLKELTERWTLKGRIKDLLLRNVDFQFQLTGTPAARLFFPYPTNHMYDCDWLPLPW